MAQHYSNLDRALLIAPESAWGQEAQGGVAVLVADGGLTLAPARTYYQPKAPSAGPDSENIPLGVAPRGGLTMLLNADTVDVALQMGLARGGASAGWPLGSYTITDLNQAGTRRWTGCLSQRMTLSADRKSGAVTVAHDIVGKREVDGPSWSVQSWDWKSLVSARNISVTIGGTEWLWESFTLTVANLLVEGPPASTAGYPVSLASRYQGRTLRFSSAIWTEEGQAFADWLRQWPAPVSLAIGIAAPGHSARTISAPRVVPQTIARPVAVEQAQRDTLVLVGRQASGGNVFLV